REAANDLGNPEAAAWRRHLLPFHADALVGRKEALVALPDVLTQDLRSVGARSLEYAREVVMRSPGVGRDLAFGAVRERKAVAEFANMLRQCVEVEHAVAAAAAQAPDEHDAVRDHGRRIAADNRGYAFDVKNAASHWRSP